MALLSRRSVYVCMYGYIAVCGWVAPRHVQEVHTPFTRRCDSDMFVAGAPAKAMQPAAPRLYERSMEGAPEKGRCR